MSSETTTRVFVYGTLRRDPSHEMFHLLAKYAHFVGDATVAGRLFDLGDYPGMVLSDDMRRVVGELYEIDKAHWKRVIKQLDQYEGCSADDPAPHEYRRELVDAQLSRGSSLAAWAYVLNSRSVQYPEIESGDYLAWRAREHSRPVHVA